MQVRLFKPVICEEAIAAAGEAMRSGWLGMGAKVAAFERAFAEFINVPHAVAVNTCTSALHMAFRLLNLPLGAEVITTPITFVATNQVLLWEGLKPVFADVDPLTGNISAASVSEKMTEQTGAILAVHFGGHACDLAALEKLGVPVVEDCAHACGGWYGEKRIGASGNLCAFSFGATKNLTTGDGGMLILPQEGQLGAAHRLRYLGLTKDIFRRVNEAGAALPHWEYDVPTAGLRYHMNDVDAAIGLAQLKHVDEQNRRRAEIARRYDELLANIPGIRLPQFSREHRSSHYLYWVLADERNALAEALQARGVTVSVHYKPTTHYPIFEKAELPGAEAFYAKELSLPMHIDLTDEEIEYVADAIRRGW